VGVANPLWTIWMNVPNVKPVLLGGLWDGDRRISVQNPYAHEWQRNYFYKVLILLSILVGGTSFELVTPAV
jgi:hypothetical protein